jgi:hypothetical protein
VQNEVLAEIVSALVLLGVFPPVGWLLQGKHTLTLQFANALHESYGSKWSSSVTVNVQ